jgi:phage regulator Rha-like protein
MKVIKIEDIKDKLIIIRDEQVLLDSDVAEIYGVETKRVNEAVKNNKGKFPVGYLLDLSDETWDSLRSKISTLNSGKRGEHRKHKPKVFTERGLYMLATILKGEQALHTTIAIVDTFYKIRNLSKNINALTHVKDDIEQKSLMQKSGEIIAEVLGDDLVTTGAETTIELNFAMIKFKHTLKKEKR